MDGATMDRRGILALLVLVLLVSAPLAAAVQETTLVRTQRTTSLYVAAVGQRADGSLTGILSVLTLAATYPGKGDVFVRAQPLAEVDMQGAARLAVAAAGEFTGRDAAVWDYHFTITTGSSIIGGPSAGGAMAVAAIAVLMNWTLAPDVAMTGMVNPDLSIGPVGGILHKAEAVAGAGVRTFLIPAGERVQYTTVTRPAPNGGVEQRQEAIDVAAHADREWGLRVVEAEDLYDAIPHFAGVATERPSAEHDPTQEAQYRELMQQTSASQYANAQAQLDAARAAATGAAPGMASGERAAVQRALDAAQEGLARAQNATTAGRHYQASSFAFQSLVESRYALALAGYDRNGNQTPAAYTAAYLDEAEASLDRARSDIAKPYPLSANEVGAQAAIEIRFGEAERLLASARDDLATGRLDSSLRSGAFALERVGSARWWATLRDSLSDVGNPPDVSLDALRGLGREYQSTAILTVAYAERIFGPGGSSDGRVAEARVVLQEASASLQGDRPAAATFRFLHVLSLVNAAIAGLSPPDALQQRLASLRDRTAYEVEVVRAQGVEPVYAVSLYEFALHLQSTNPAEAYEGLSYARMAARATLVAGGYEPPPLEWRPLPGLHLFSPAQRILQGAAWAWMTLVALPGVLGLAVAAVLATRAPPGAKGS
jgi:uncharacterized protein